MNAPFDVVLVVFQYLYYYYCRFTEEHQNASADQADQVSQSTLHVHGIAWCMVSHGAWYPAPISDYIFVFFQTLYKNPHSFYF